MWGIYVSLIHTQFQIYFPEYLNPKTNSHCSHWLHPGEIYQRERELIFVEAEALTHLIFKIILPGILWGRGMVLQMTRR